MGTAMLHTLCPITNAQAYQALIPSAGSGVNAWKSQPSNDGLNMDWSTMPASITPYAAPSSRIVGQPRPVRRVTSRIRQRPAPVQQCQDQQGGKLAYGDVAEQKLPDPRGQ